MTRIREPAESGRSPLFALPAHRGRGFDLAKRQSNVRRWSTVEETSGMELDAAAGGERVGDTHTMPRQRHRRPIVPVLFAHAQPAEADVVLIVVDTLRERRAREVVRGRELPL